jgi:hypothetical protein
MADEVQISFGAKIDGLVHGVSEVKNQLASIKESTDKVSEGAKSMLEIFGIGLSFAGFVEFVNKMSELGERLEVTGYRLGANAEQIVQLSGMARITSTSLEALSMSVERMTLNVQRAASSVIDPTAQALKVLGLNAKDLVGLPIDQYFLKIAGAVEKFNPSLNLTNALMQIGGRSFANLVPILREGVEGWNKYQAIIKEASQGLAASIPGMADTNTKISILGLSLQSFGARVFTVLKPAIDAAITAFSKLLQSIDSETIVKAAQKIAEALVSIMGTLGTFAITIMGAIEQMTNKLDTFANKAAAAAGGASGGAVGGFVVGGPVGAGLGAVGGGLAGWFGAEYLSADQAAAEGNEKLEQRRRELGLLMLKFKMAAQAVVESLNPKPASEEKGGANAGAINFNIANQIAALATNLDAQIALMQSSYERRKSIYQFDLDTFQISQREKTTRLREALSQEYEAEKNLLTQKLALYAGQPEKRAEVNKALLALDQKYAMESLKITQDQVKSQVEKWKEVTDALQSSFNSQLRGMLAGTVSFGQAFKTILGDMIIFFIQAVEKMVVQWALGKAAEVATTTEAEAAKTGIVAASSAAQAAAQLPLILKNIAASIGSVFAGVSAFLAPLMGPAAPGAAAGVAAGVEATALSIVGSAEGGAYDVTGGLWQLHPREMVLPEPVADTVRDAMQGGGPNGSSGGGMHFHGMLIDGPSIARLFRDHAGLMADALKGKASLSPSKR